jgi:cytochrome c
MAIMLSPAAVARGGIWLPSAGNTSWQSECAACHIAFPAQLLPPSDWRKIMSQLDRHFGTDVSLDGATHQEILDYLQHNGADEPLFSNPQMLPRITSSERFADKHRGAIRLWHKGQIKTLTDCAACHRDAGLGVLKN